MSPNSQSASVEDIRRAISPPVGSRSVKPPNGLLQQALPINGKPKIPIRGKRDEDVMSTDDGADVATSDSQHRDRAASPEQEPKRARSPTQVGGSRAVSPAQDPYSGQQPTMATVAMGMNGGAVRSESPAINRPAPPVSQSNAPPSGSPTSTSSANGHANSAPSTSAAVESANAEAVRDLKAKELELESMKKKTVWMKMALAQAYRSGFVYNADTNEDQDMAMNTEADSEDPGEQRIADMVVRFKQFKTQMQVCNQCSNCGMMLIWV